MQVQVEQLKFREAQDKTNITQTRNIYKPVSTVARSAFSVFRIFLIAVSLMLSLIVVVTEFDIPTFILPSHFLNHSKHITRNIQHGLQQHCNAPSHNIKCSIMFPRTMFFFFAKL